jgi:hypothetical protein
MEKILMSVPTTYSKNFCHTAQNRKFGLGESNRAALVKKVFRLRLLSGRQGEKMNLNDFTLEVCDNHDDCIVIFDRRNLKDCPICAEMGNLEKENSDHEDEIAVLREQVTDFEEFTGLQEGWNE